MLLYDYHRSTAAYRVRIALELKGIAAQRKEVDLLHGEHVRADFLRVNHQGLLPALALDDGAVLTQSLAIVEYLDAIRPEPRLVPEDPVVAAQVRSVALMIACDIHPLGAPRVVAHLKERFHATEDEIGAWRRKWQLGGLEAVEEAIRPGPYCCGQDVTLADVCLMPQLYSARRFEVPLDGFPRILAVEKACEEHPAFHAAHPARRSSREQE
ncbi:maleylacetoacetate isomerase [Methylocystis heyeri]|uniref:Maleylacetoacetate isomerase n=1 Tax=Methylocystis heyeri TaxID=391905 RepID=A0A6B8KJX0_9HYPH|nr:maleylacetoacetate isomerase [Methylocystis heyeri]QGM47235.1 maleylacetoacetate isomerase [Methylocystis heyeri]